MGFGPAAGWASPAGCAAILGERVGPIQYRRRRPARGIGRGDMDGGNRAKVYVWAKASMTTRATSA